MAVVCVCWLKIEKCRISLSNKQTKVYKIWVTSCLNLKLYCAHALVTHSHTHTLTHTPQFLFPFLTQLFIQMRCLLSVFVALTNILLFHIGQYTSNWRIESHITFVTMTLCLHCSEILRIRTWMAKNRNNCSNWYSLLQAGIWKSTHAWCTQQIATVTEHFLLHAVRLETVIVNVTKKVEGYSVVCCCDVRGTPWGGLCV